MGHRRDVIRKNRHPFHRDQREVMIVGHEPEVLGGSRDVEVLGLVVFHICLRPAETQESMQSRETFSGSHVAQSSGGRCLRLPAVPC